MFLVCRRRTHSSRGRRQCLSPRLRLYAPVLPGARGAGSVPVHRRASKGLASQGLESSISLMRPLSTTVLKVIKCRGFSEWKGMCRPYHGVFSQLRKDVKFSDTNKSCPCTRVTLEQRSVRGSSSEGPVLKRAWTFKKQSTHSQEGWKF